MFDYIELLLLTSKNNAISQEPSTLVRLDHDSPYDLVMIHQNNPASLADSSSEKEESILSYMIENSLQTLPTRSFQLWLGHDSTGMLPSSSQHDNLQKKKNRIPAG
jgi:hypothetical protein